MTDRSNPRIQNQELSKAFDAVNVIRRECAELHRGPEAHASITEAGDMTAAIIPTKREKTSCNRERDHI